jgi:hypothetical protein
MKKRSPVQKIRSLAIELGLYDALLLALQDYIAPIQVNGNILATLDCCFVLQRMHSSSIIKDLNCMMVLNSNSKTAVTL